MLAPVLGLLALISLATGVALGAAHSSNPEPSLAPMLARLRHAKIAPRRLPHSSLSPVLVGTSSTHHPIIGTNDGAGWGAAAARIILRGHISWNRVELGAPTNTLWESRRAGFKTLAIVGNLADERPLSSVDPSSWGAEVLAELKHNEGISIAEAGNESYLKGDVANPVAYGRMYLDAVEDLKAAGIHTPLLFNMTGDIPLGTWANPGTWSEDAHGGGWLRDAVAGVPGLAAAILANGVSIHPYGLLGVNTHDDFGIGSAAAEEAVASAVLGSMPPFYVTEIGYSLSDCGGTTGACSEHEQATKLQAAYEVFLADPNIQGIWWYQSHDDPTGAFGFMNAHNRVRPAFKVLTAIAAAVGQ
jgi:hypothetical protein